MNKAMSSTSLSQHTRRWLTLALVLLSTLGVIVLNNLGTAVDISSWSRGFIHPLHGGDHLLTMLAVGIWAAQMRGTAIWLLPLTFVGVMSIGGLAGAAGVLIPIAEPIILLSCLVFSVFIVRKIRFSSQTNLIIVAFFAFFHGFAHGQEISTSASLISYTLGFMIATLLLHGAGILVLRLLVMLLTLILCHVTYAQSTADDSSANSIVPTQSDKAYELTLSTHSTADNEAHRLLLYSVQGIASDSEVDKYRTTGDHPPISDNHRNFLRIAKYNATNARTSTLVTNNDSPSYHKPGKHFLTNGVGATSPPIAIAIKDTPRFCPTAHIVHFADIPANDGNQVTATTPELVLFLIRHTLAIRFLTNGLGTTAPPVHCRVTVISSPHSDGFAFRSPHSFISFAERPLTLCLTLFSSHRLLIHPLSNTGIPFDCLVTPIISSSPNYLAIHNA